LAKRQDGRNIFFREAAQPLQAEQVHGDLLLHCPRAEGPVQQFSSLFCNLLLPFFIGWIAMFVPSCNFFSQPSFSDAFFFCQNAQVVNLIMREPAAAAEAKKRQHTLNVSIVVAKNQERHFFFFASVCGCLSYYAHTDNTQEKLRLCSNMFVYDRKKGGGRERERERERVYRKQTLF
jgi:hypothetical protein